MAQPRIVSCDTCNHQSKNMQDLNKHMAVMHKESDHMRIERLTQTFEADMKKTSVISKNYDKLYDCSECGDLFVTWDQLNKHIERHHIIKSEEWQDKEVQHQVKTKQIVEDKEAILTLTSDLTNALMNIPLPEEDIHTIIEADRV